MTIIEKEVCRARRRLALARFARTLCWSLGVAWLVAAIAIGVRSIWLLPVQIAWWDWGWLGGASAVGVLIALTVTWWSLPSLQQVAVEIDLRCGLNERLSSAVALPAPLNHSAMGQALLADATARAKTIDIRDRFSLSPRPVGWLPVLPAVLLGACLLLPPATADPDDALSAAVVSQTNQVKTAAEVLRRKISQQRQRAEEVGLKDAEDLFRKLEADIDKLAQRRSLDRKEAMIAINDIKQQLDQRRNQLGTPEQMRDTLAKMDAAASGPAGEVVKAMQQGDFGEARQHFQQLADQLRSGQLSQEDQEQLQKQIDAIGDRMAKAIETHEQAKEQLQQQIDQAKRDGRDADAAKMQQQLAQLEAQDAQMQQMGQMCDSLSQAAEAMQDGRNGEASDALQELADQLGNLQADMDQLEDIQETIDSLAQSKNQMRCQGCAGGGCDQCQVDGQMPDGLDQPGGGLGSGIGTGTAFNQHSGDDTETSSYDSQVRGQPKQGRAVVAGFADGPNRKGVTREQIKDAVLGAISDQTDPLENQLLPRSARDHARQYFDRLREGRSEP